MQNQFAFDRLRQAKDFTPAAAVNDVTQAEHRHGAPF